MRDEPVQHDSQSSRDVEASPLDPFVDRVVGWIAEVPGGVPANGLSAAIAGQFEWPLAFAEAILVSVNGRRLLRPNHMSNRPFRLMLSPRGHERLEQ